MITITQRCDRDGTTRELTEKEHRRNNGWRNIEGLELCPECVRDFTAWVKAGKETTDGAESVPQEQVPTDGPGS